MRLTKGMKKILSLALTGALVITGANVTGGANKQAKAADASITWTSGYGDSTQTITADGDVTFTVEGSAKTSVQNFGYFDNTKFSDTAVKAVFKSLVVNDTADYTIEAKDVAELNEEITPADGDLNAICKNMHIWGSKDGGYVYAQNDKVKIAMNADKSGIEIIDAAKNEAISVTKIALTFTFSGIAAAAPSASADVSADPSASADASTEPSADVSAEPAEPLPYGLVEGTEGAAVPVPFIAYIANNGNINDWNGEPSNPEAQIKIEKEGTYKLSCVVAKDMDTIVEQGYLGIGTDLLKMPTDMDMIGISIAVNDEVYELDQEYARLYLDGTEGNIGEVRVGITKDLSWGAKEWSNTTKDADIPVKAGDIFTVIFKVVNQTPADFNNHDEEPTPSVAPSTAPSASPSAAPATNACKKVTAAKKTVSVKRGKTKTITFKITNTNKSALTTDKISVKSSNKKVTAKVSKKTATKITVKVKVNKKAKKKSKAKITLKVGKKSAKTTIKVK